jgi:excinuclease ABC subunit C
MSKVFSLEKLKEKALSLPKTAGCYLMLNQSGDIIYVGKAKNLKNRVTSYFNQSDKSVKTQFLVSHIADFDFILTKSDIESFILENNLIKKHRPKYNIRMKDDKSYPYVMVEKSEIFPRLEYVRRPKPKKTTELFGPYPVGLNVSEVIRALTKIFKLRDCSLHEFHSRKQPCVLYQIHQCSAPCVKYINEEDYEKSLECSMNILRGGLKARDEIKNIKVMMEQLSNEEKFEEAVKLRDGLVVLEEFFKKSNIQNVEFLKEEKDIDVVAFYEGLEEIDISFYMIRDGALLGHKNFHLMNSDLIESVDEEILKFLIQYYSEEVVFPNRVITHLKKENCEILESVLKEFSKGTTVDAGSKKYKSLIEMTRNYAEEAQRVRIKNQDSVYIGMNKLKELLNLKERPKILECYDIAIWQGKSPTASQIVFIEGKPEKNLYRYYHLEERPEGNNDFAMMKEVLTRRLDNKKLPDIFIVDGGVAQVNMFLEVLKEAQIEIPVVGIAKAREQNEKKTEERLIIPGRSNPFILNKSPSLFKIIVQMRDEAHRFSRKLHHKEEKKRSFTTWLDEINGIGPKTKELILKNNSKTQDELKLLSINELEDYLDISEKHAKLLHEFLHD